MYLVFITIMGLILRLVNIIKPQGLWNDEYVSWSIANIPFGTDFWTAVKSQCHLPFYYFYLKFMMFIGGTNDTFLRLTSVIPGVIAIPIMYMVGLEIDKTSKKTAIIASTITACSAFLVYYSQEVRFYELLFLFSALSLLFTLKLVSAPNKKNTLGYIVSNLFILLTHTIGFVFVFFSISYVLLKLYTEKRLSKKHLSAVCIPTIAVIILSSPLIINTFKISGIAQWWGIFSIRNIGFLFTDYFSPILTNLVNAPAVFLYNRNPVFLFFMLIPVIATLIAMLFGVKKYKGLTLVVLLYLFVLCIAAIHSKLVFITKYTIEIYPILIMFASLGFSTVKKHHLGTILFCTYLIPNLMYVFNPDYASNLPRNEGHKIVADLLKKTEIKPNDTVIFTYYDHSRFEKYLKTRDYNTLTVNKGNIKEFYGLSQADKYLTEQSFETLNQNLTTRILSASKNKVYIVFLDSVEIFSPNQIELIINSQKLSENVPIQYLYFSGLKNELINIYTSKYSNRTFINQGSWTIGVFYN